MRAARAQLCPGTFAVLFRLQRVCVLVLAWLACEDSLVFYSFVVVWCGHDRTFALRPSLGRTSRLGMCSVILVRAFLCVVLRTENCVLRCCRLDHLTGMVNAIKVTRIIISGLFGVAARVPCDTFSKPALSCLLHCGFSSVICSLFEYPPRIWSAGLRPRRSRSRHRSRCGLCGSFCLEMREAQFASVRAVVVVRSSVAADYWHAFAVCQLPS